MRKVTLLLSFLVVAGLAFGQQATLRPTEGKETLKAVKQVKKDAAKSTVIWSEDFNGETWSATVTEDGKNGYTYNGTTELPEGWSVYDANDAGFFWHWSDVGPRGRYTSGQGAGPGAFTPREDFYNLLEGSKENGFFVLESDFYNTTETGAMVSDPIDMDSYVQFGPIDFSESSAIEFSISQVFRFCCTSDAGLNLELSKDFDPQDPTSANWIKLDLKDGAVGNEVKYGTVTVNVTQYIAKESSVYFRIRQSMASHYFWLIDDITFKVPENETDVTLTDAWYDYIVPGLPASSTMDASFRFTGGYSKIPVQVADQFVAFRASVQNMGWGDATFNSNVIIAKDDVLVYDETSAAITQVPGQVDTAKIETAFILRGKGFYQVSGTIITQKEDAKPTDNIFSYEFEVNEDVYSRVIEEDVDNYVYAGPHDWVDGGLDGDAIAQYYDLPEGSGNVELKSIQFYMPAYDLSGWTGELNAILDGDYSVIARVWIDGETPTVIAYSDSYTIKESDLGSWVTIPLLDEGNLIIPEVEGGQSIMVGLELFSGNKDLYWSIGADNENIKQPLNGGVVYIKFKDTWYVTGDNYAINLITVDHSTPQVNLSFNVNMNAAIDGGSFNVDEDVVYVTGDFVGWNEPGKGYSKLMADEDGDGIYTAVAEVDVNSTVKYKYFKNAGWDGGEWSGGADRSVAIAEGDVAVNDVWGDNAVEENQLAAVSVYPNPFNEQLVIENAVNVAKVTVSTVVGQTLMVKTNITEKTYISTAELSTGVYFVTFTDKNNNNRTVRVVKQ